MQIETIHNAIDKIDYVINNYSPGYKNTEALDIIRKNLYSLRQIAHRNPPIFEKIDSIDSYIDILYSQRKHQGYGGVENVRSIINKHIYVLRSLVNRMDEL